MSLPTPLAKKQGARKRTLAERNEIAQSSSSHQKSSSSLAATTTITSSSSKSVRSGHHTKRRRVSKNDPKEMEATSIKEAQLHALSVLRELEEQANMLKFIHYRLTDQMHRLQVEEMLIKQHIDVHERQQGDLTQQVSNYISKFVGKVFIKSEPNEDAIQTISESQKLQSTTPSNENVLPSSYQNPKPSSSFASSSSSSSSSSTVQVTKVPLQPISQNQQQGSEKQKEKNHHDGEKSDSQLNIRNVPQDLSSMGIYFPESVTPSTGVTSSSNVSSTSSSTSFTSLLNSGTTPVNNYANTTTTPTTTTTTTTNNLDVVNDSVNAESDDISGIPSLNIPPSLQTSTNLDNMDFLIGFQQNPPSSHLEGMSSSLPPDLLEEDEDEIENQQKLRSILMQELGE